MGLSQKHCVPCEGGTKPLEGKKLDEYRPLISSAWSVLDSKKLHRDFSLKDFAEAMKFVNGIAAIAEREGHHPDISIFYNHVVVELWTHAIGGLSENDFILAVNIDSLA